MNTSSDNIPQLPLHKRRSRLFVASIVCFCCALLLYCLQGEERLNDESYFVFAIGMVSCSFGALICGASAWKSLAQSAKVTCGIIISLSALMMTNVLWWIQDTTMHPSHMEEFEDLQTQADRAFNTGNYEVAAQVYKVIVQKEQSGWFHNYSFDDLKLADVLEKQKKFGEAERVLVDTLQNPDRIPDKYRVTCVQNLAIFYLGQKRYEFAEPLFKRALQMHHQNDHTWESMLCREDYAELLKATGRDEAAAKLEQEAKEIRAEFDRR